MHFIDENQPVKSWEYAVLVCNTDYEVEHIGQLYRDRAGLNHILAVAPQLEKAQRWPAMLRYIVRQILSHQASRGAALVPAPTG